MAQTKRYVTLPLLILAVIVASISLFAGRLHGEVLTRARKQKGASAMTQSQQRSRSGKLVPQYLTSLDGARAAYGFQLLMPTAVPTGFQLDSIKHISNQSPEVDQVAVRFTMADGHYLSIMQGIPVVYDDGVVKWIPETDKGTTTVQGRPAVWARGRVTMGGPGQYGHRPGPLVLRWETGPANASGGQVGYTLESDVLTLDQLVAVGNSVQP